MPMKVQWRKCPASIHSTNATWQTSFGLVHRHWSIFSAVSDSPHRDALFSGRFLNGHCGVCRREQDGGVPKARLSRSSGNSRKGAKRPKSHCGIQKMQLDRCSPRFQSPTRNTCCHCRKSPLKPMLWRPGSSRYTPLPRLRPGSIGIHAQMPSIGCPNVRFPPSQPLRWSESL